jgi:hypothetical protein
MYGTPGGIVLIFGGDVMYSWLAIRPVSVIAACSRGKIPLALVRMMIFQNPFRSFDPKLSLPGRSVPSGRRAFRRGDVFHMNSKRLTPQQR